MLAGELGPQKQQIEELADFLADELKPDVVCFSNALLAGSLRTIKQRFDGPVFCTLQGDDIFLDGLPLTHRSQVIECISERAAQFDVMGKDTYKKEEYYTYFRVLETDDEYFNYYRKRHAHWKMYGLALPDSVLRKVYYQNALNVIPGIDKTLFDK